MDYTKKDLLFKIRKALRYLRLYGLGRTLIKIKGQYHMNRKYDVLPGFRDENAHSGNIAVVGCGNYSFSNIAYYLSKNYGCVIRAALDVDVNRAVSLFQEYKACYYTTDFEKILNDDKIELIYIASNHHSHAEYAKLALLKGKDVHIEKPHAVSFSQLKELLKAAEVGEGRVLSIGYNRPKSKFGKKIKEAFSEQSGELMMNWFVAGHELDSDHWYFSEKEGGRVLGNLCHWTDFTYSMMEKESRYPITINPTKSKKSDCDIAVTYTFGDGSIGVITFSAKGHTFEGVREKFSGHRENVLVSMDDFHFLKLEDIASKKVFRPMFRDHGHEESICGSYRLFLDKADPGLDKGYIWEAGELFLKTKEALDSNKVVIVGSAEKGDGVESG